MKKFMNKIRKNNKGFTLVELIIVVAIIAVLSAVLVPQYIQYVEKSRIGADESYISEVGHNIEIIAATDPKVNGQNIKVTLAANTGAITVDKATTTAYTGTDAAIIAANAVKAELEALFKSTDFVSNHYTSQAVTINYTAATNVLAYSGTKNLD